MTQKHQWQSYVGCFYPVLAILGLLLVLLVLAKIVHVDEPNLPLRELTPLPNYPDNIDLSASARITDAGLKWLMLSYFYWLVGLFCIGFCYWQLWRAIRDCTGAVRRSVSGIFTVSVGATVGVLYYYAVVRETPLMSFEFLLRSLRLVGQGLVDLTTYSTALAYVAIVAHLVTISLLLLPQAHSGSEFKQIQAITRTMYGAAAFLLVWIAQATEMYSFAATLLVERERDEVLTITPTISLMAGVFASLLLAAAYIAAYRHLQYQHRHQRQAQSVGEGDIAEKSPKQFLLKHWPRITAVLMPILPGALGSVFNLLAQPI